MKRLWFIAPLLISLSLSACKQEASVPADRQGSLHAHVSYLASGDLEGRRTGEKGATLAADYIADRFARYGITPAADNFRQSFPYVAGIEPGEGNALRFTGFEKPVTVEFAKNWAPSGFSPNGAVSAKEIVFAGFGISSENHKYDNFARLDVTDKIVLAFDGVPADRTFSGFTIHAKASIAKDKGATALILISRQDNFHDDKNALRFDPTLGETAIPTLFISRQMAADVLGVDNAWLTAEEKNLNAREKAASVADAAIDQPMAADITIDLRHKTSDVYNVIGVLKGNDPVLRDEVIVIGAHYDHLGHGGQGSLSPDSAEIHYGADDNASGTAALLELAKEFSEKATNKRTIAFIAFTGEEQGALGSKFFVNNPAFPLEKIIAMINMDMIGRLKDDSLTVGGLGTASQWPDLIEKQSSISAFTIQREQEGFGTSDHMSFYGKKIPVLFFCTGTHADYHKPTDTVDKINVEGLAKVTDFIARIVSEIDANPLRPTYTEVKSQGTGGRRGYSISLGTIPSYAGNDNTGLVLDAVRPGSPADKAGMKNGDKIIKLAGRDVRNISDYKFVMGEMRAGQPYDVRIVRDGEDLDFKIVPDPRD